MPGSSKLSEHFTTAAAIDALEIAARQTQCAMATLDARGYITWASEHFCTRCSYRNGNVAGHFASTLLNGLGVDPQEVAAINEKVANQQTYLNERVNCRHEGDQQWVTIELHPLADNAGFTLTIIDQPHTDNADRKLQRMRERYMLMSKATRDVIWDYDVVNDHIWRSDNLYYAFGHDPVGSHTSIAWWSELVHPDDRERVIEGLKDAMSSTRQNWTAEYRLCRADGSYAHVIDRASIVRDADGKPLRLVGAIMDMTRQKGIEEKLRLQKMLFECQTEASLDGILVVDNQRRIISHNRRFVEMWGISDEILATGRDDLVLQSALSKVVNADEFIERAEYLYEHPDVVSKDSIELRDGRTFDRHTAVVKTDDDTIYGRVWYFRDVTATRRYEAQLEQHNLVVENSNAVVFRWRATEDWPVELVTENVAQFGYTASELLEGKVKFASMVHPDDVARVAGEVHMHSVSGAESFEQEYRLVCRNGEVRWIFDRTVVERDKSGQVTHYQGIVFDITERKHSEFRTQKLLHDLEERVKENRTLIAVLRAMNQHVTDIDHTLQVIANTLPLGFQYPSCTAARVTYGGKIYESCGYEPSDHCITEPFICENGSMGLIEVVAVYERDEDDDADRFFDEERQLIHTVADALKSHLERLRIDEQLRQHRIVVENSNTLLFRWRATEGWPVEMVSDNIRQFGYIAEDLLSGKVSFESIVHPDDRAWVEQEVLDCLERDIDALDQEYRIVCRNGEVRWVYDRTTAERNEHGEITHFQGLIIDITDRCEAEQALRESEERMRNIASQVPGAVFQFRIDSHGQRSFPYISKGIEDLCGVSTGEIVSNPMAIMQTILPEEVEHIDASIDESARTMESWREEFRIRHCDGSIRWISGQSIPTRQDDGSILWHGLLLDITERKTSENELRRLTAIIEATTDFVGVADADGKAVYINAAGRRMIGFQHDESIADLDITTMSPPWAAKKLTQEAIPTAITEGVWVGEMALQHRDGHEIPVSQLILAHKNAYGEVEHLSTVMRDITIRKRAEDTLKEAKEAAEEASRAKSEFLANMSHEIRTPLTAIIGYAELLRCDESLITSTERREQCITTILNAGEHLMTVINDILDISKIEAGHMHAQLAKTSLPQLIDEVATLMAVRARDKSVTLDVHFATAVPETVMTDATRLRQILMNLTGNAVKFTDEGTVTIEVTHCQSDDGDRLTIDVRDTGPGLTDKQQSKLFTAFSQADSSVTRKHGGTGLGLVISQRLAELMGGKVFLQWSQLGKGSCFRIELPLELVAGTRFIRNIDEVATLQTFSVETGPIQLHGRILLAEDGIENQRLLQTHLTKAGAVVDVANDGVIAMEMLEDAARKGTPYDLLVTDMQMPEMDGYTLASMLRHNGWGIPIIALTAHAMAEDRDLCLQSGCNGYASKPIKRAALLRLCAQWLPKSRVNQNEAA